MYKRILLPTDGSALSRQAIQSGILFAKNSGATIVGVHVIPELREEQLEAWLHHDPDFSQRHQALLDKFADEYLIFVANSALAEEIPCACKKIKSSDTCHGIIKAAEQTACDLIYMASHGWRGDQAQFLGSVTLQVLIHSKVPVLVHKPALNIQGK